MEKALDGRAAARRDIRFVQVAAAILLALTLFAFMPQYLVPLLGGDYSAPNNWMHPHAVAGFGFALLFLVQPTLIARGNIALHRTLGRIVAVLVVVAVVSGVGVQLGMFPAPQGDLSNRFAGAFRLFQTLPSLMIFFFGALLLRRRTDWHWRWMYLAAFTPFNTISHRLLVNYSNMAEPDIMPLVGLLTLLPVVLLPIYDKIAHPKVHAASWMGLAIVVVLQGVAFSMLSTQFWGDLINGA